MHDLRLEGKPSLTRIFLPVDYQKKLSFCASCKKSVTAVSMGKYCVRFGADVRQFCSSGFLDVFKPGADFLAIFCATSCFLGIFCAVDFLAVCLVLAMMFQDEVKVMEFSC